MTNFLYTGQSKLDNPGAGFKDTCGVKCTVEDTRPTPDMRKAVHDHGSPNLEIKLSRSPMLVHGRVELFGDMAVMIDHWNEKEKEEGAQGGKKEKERGGRRRSKRIDELCGIFGEGKELDQISQPDNCDRVGGEGGNSKF